MSYHFCCFRTLNQDPCPTDFPQSGQEVLSVVWKMCNTDSCHNYSRLMESLNDLSFIIIDIFGFLSRTFKTGCRSGVHVILDKSSADYVVKSMEENHNHEVSVATYRHYPENRRLTESEKEVRIRAMMIQRKDWLLNWSQMYQCMRNWVVKVWHLSDDAMWSIVKLHGKRQTNVRHVHGRLTYFTDTDVLQNMVHTSLESHGIWCWPGKWHFVLNG